MKRILLTLSLTAALTAPAATLAVAANATSTPNPSPTARAAAIFKMWRANLRGGARADPSQHFPNPSNATLASRLRHAASRYHFRVVAVEILHPRQAAPFIVVEAKDKHSLATSTCAILHLIDRKTRTNDDRTGLPTRASCSRRATAMASRS